MPADCSVLSPPAAIVKQDAKNKRGRVLTSGHGPFSLRGLASIKAAQLADAAQEEEDKEGRRVEREGKRQAKVAELEEGRGEWRACNPGMAMCVCRHHTLRSCKGGLRLCSVCSTVKKRVCMMKACVEADTAMVGVLELI